MENSKLPSDQLADYQRLVDGFYLTLKAKLSKDYVMTDTPTAGAMRIQVAIINGGQANAALKVAKTVEQWTRSGRSRPANRRLPEKSRSST